MTMDCAFCAIVAGVLPASVAAETERSLAFLDLRQPHAEHQGMHVLVVPKRHVEFLDGLSVDDGADLLALASRITGVLRKNHPDASVSLWQSNGVAAFQEVPHVHLHVLSRRVDDRLLAIYPTLPPDAGRDRLDRDAARLRTQLSAAMP